nr:MAG TPA: hypothetical protein [Ackermannviridae sp.]
MSHEIASYESWFHHFVSHEIASFGQTYIAVSHEILHI